MVINANSFGKRLSSGILLYKTKKVGFRERQKKFLDIGTPPNQEIDLDLFLSISTESVIGFL